MSPPAGNSPCLTNSPTAGTALHAVLKLLDFASLSVLKIIQASQSRSAAGTKGHPTLLSLQGSIPLPLSLHSIPGCGPHVAPRAVQCPLSPGCEPLSLINCCQGHLPSVWPSHTIKGRVNRRCSEHSISSTNIYRDFLGARNCARLGP